MLEGVFMVMPWVYSDNTLVEHLLMYSHVGTHIESSYHQDPSGKSIGEIPVESLIGEGVVLNLSRTIDERDFLDPSMAEEVTERYGMSGPIIGKKHLDAYSDKIKDNDIVLLYTELPIEKRALIGEEAADWLIKKSVKAVGIHDWSIVFTRKAHEKLLMNGVTLIETLVNLDKISGERVYIIALPLKIIGLGASPARVIAVEDF